MSKIAHVTLNVVKIPVYIGLATQKISSTHHLIVRIQVEEGSIGIGEGTPYLTEIYNVYAIGKKIASTLNGKEVTEALDILPRMQAEMVSESRFDYGPFLAFETAIIDVVSKINRVSFSKLLGGTFRQEVPVCGTITLSHPHMMANMAKKWVFKKGVDHLKVKVWGNTERDALNLQSIRDAIGCDALLRIDANQGYKNVKKAADSINSLGKFDIGIVEQPLKWHDLTGLRKLRKIVTPKIMVDESLRKPSDIDLIAEQEAADIIYFHASKLGCLSTTRDAIDKTVGLGLQYMIGAGPLTGIGAAALLQLAASRDDLCYPNEEVGLYEAFGRDIVSNPLKVHRGCMRIPSGYGLGVALEEKDLAKYRIDLSPLKMSLMDFAYYTYGKSSMPIRDQFRKIYGMLMKLNQHHT